MPKHSTLREWRKAKRLNQTDAGKMFGATQAIYSKWETGKSVPVKRRWRVIVDTTGVSLESLLHMRRQK